MKEENPVESGHDELEMMWKNLERGVSWRSQKADVSRRNWSTAPNGSRKARRRKPESCPLDLMTEL